MKIDLFGVHVRHSIKILIWRKLLRVFGELEILWMEYEFRYFSGRILKIDRSCVRHSVKILIWRKLVRVWSIGNFNNDVLFCFTQVLYHGVSANCFLISSKFKKVSRISRRLNMREIDIST